MRIQTQSSPITREQALEIAKRAEEILKTRYGATRVIVFGSARGDAPWHTGSDLDLAVEGLRKGEFFSAWSYLEHQLNAPIRIELHDLKGLSPEMQARIYSEVEMPKERVPALRILIADELKTLDRLVARLGQIQKNASDPPDVDDLDLMGLQLHRFYTAAESILERIALEFDAKPTKTGTWHTDLLTGLAEPNADTRPAVLDRALWLRLDDLRRFRHFIRHGYAEDLEWDEMEGKVEGAQDTLAMFRRQIEQFFVNLAEMKRDDTSSSDESPS